MWNSVEDDDDDDDDDKVDDAVNDDLCVNPGTLR